eukprot:6843241-Pyramimonas_sp.AAC.1
MDQRSPTPTEKGQRTLPVRWVPFTQSVADAPHQQVAEPADHETISSDEAPLQEPSAPAAAPAAAAAAAAERADVTES